MSSEPRKISPRRQQHSAREVPPRMPSLPSVARGSPRTARPHVVGAQSSPRSEKPLTTTYTTKLPPPASPRRDKTEQYKVIREQEPWGIHLRAEAVAAFQEERAQSAAAKQRNRQHAQALEEQMNDHRKNKINSKQTELERERRLAKEFEEELRRKKQAKQDAGLQMIKERQDFLKKRKESKERAAEEEAINFAKQRNAVEYQIHEDAKRVDIQRKETHRKIVSEMQESQATNKKMRENHKTQESKLDKELAEAIVSHESAEAKRRYEDHMRRVNTVALNATVGNGGKEATVQQELKNLDKKLEKELINDLKRLEEEAKRKQITKKKEAIEMTEFLKRQIRERQLEKKQLVEEDRQIRKVQDKDTALYKAEMREQGDKKIVNNQQYSHQLTLQVFDNKERNVKETLSPIQVSPRKTV